MISEGQVQSEEASSSCVLVEEAARHVQVRAIGIFASLREGVNEARWSQARQLIDLTKVSLQPIEEPNREEGGDLLRKGTRGGNAASLCRNRGRWKLAEDGRG